MKVNLEIVYDDDSPNKEFIVVLRKDSKGYMQRFTIPYSEKLTESLFDRLFDCAKFQIKENIIKNR
jgi:hypothetical protein